MDHAYDPLDTDDSSGDSRSDSPCAEAKFRRQNNKNKSKAVARKSKHAAKLAAAANKNGLKALQDGALFLSSKGGIEGITDWIENEELPNSDFLHTLQRCCTEIATLLKFKASPLTASQDTSTSAKIEDEYYVFRASSHSVKLLGTIESFACNRLYSSKKVLGFIRRPGEGFPYMVAFPGWGACVDSHSKVLDSKIWSERALKFARNIGHQFRTDGFDTFHGKPFGASYASHVEPMLMLFYAHQIFVKTRKEDFSLRRLHLIRLTKAKIEADIFVSEEPCRSCKVFQELVEAVTGIKFHIKVCKNLATLVPFRTPQGYKRYPASVPESPDDDNDRDPEEYEEYERRYPLPPPSDNIAVSVPSKSNTGVVVAVKATNLNFILAKSKPSKDNAPKQSRKKRQYEQSDDDDEYQGGRGRLHSDDNQSSSSVITRASSRNRSGLLSPSPSPGTPQRK